MAGCAHATPFETSDAPPPQVHVDGQSLSLVHTIESARQLDVESVVVVQPLLGGPPSSEGMGAEAPLPPSIAADPPLAQQVVDTSCTQLKCSPQSELTAQGNSYLGMHALGSVVVVHTGTGSSGHASPFAHAGALEPLHVVTLSAWHTMPDGQSVSWVHGPGWHE